MGPTRKLRQRGGAGAFCINVNLRVKREKEAKEIYAWRVKLYLLFTFNLRVSRNSLIALLNVRRASCRIH